MAATWRIRIGPGMNNREPVYIWDLATWGRIGLPLKAVWAWDATGTVWSTGNSSRCLRSTLSYDSDLWYTNNRNSPQIHWLTRYNNNPGGKKYLLDYPASKVERDNGVAPLPNLIKHMAFVRITFRPAAPYLNPVTIDMVFQDYLNYFYITLPLSPDHVPLPPDTDHPFISQLMIMVT